MRKPKVKPLRFTQWARRELSVLPKSTADGRAAALDEALGELMVFCGHDRLRADVRAEIVRHLDHLAAEVRAELAEQNSLREPGRTKMRVSRIERLLREAICLLDEDWRAAVAVSLFCEVPPRKFMDALISLAKLHAAAREASLQKSGVRWTFFGRKSSNMAKLLFLYRVRLLMAIMGGRKVPMSKTDGPLLRFARPLWTYITGEHPKDGSFDRQVMELRSFPMQVNRKK